MPYDPRLALNRYGRRSAVSRVGSPRAHDPPRGPRCSAPPTSPRFLRAGRPRPGRQRVRRLPRPHHQARAALARRRDVGTVRRRRAGRRLPRRAPTWCRSQATEDDARAFAERALTRGRTVLHDRRPAAARSSRSGTASPTPGAGPARLRWDQPHMEIDRPPAGRARPGRTPYRPSTTSTRSTRPAWRCTPRRSASPRSRRRRGALPGPGQPADRAAAGRSPGSRSGRLVFKAEVACATPYAAQVQGVCVAPDRRGEGLAARRHGRGRRAGPRARSRRWCRSTSTSWNVPGPARPTSGSASGRPATFATIMF